MPKHTSIGKPQSWYPGINRQHSIAKDCVLCYPFTEGAGTSLRDVSGRGHDSVLVNVSTDRWTGSNYGHAYSNAGAAGGETIMPVLMDQEGGLPRSKMQMTVLCVAKAGTVTGIDFLYSQRSITAVTTDRLEMLRATTTWQFRTRVTTAGTITLNSTTVVTVGQYYTLCGRANSTNTDFFIDGVLEDGSTGFGTNTWSNSTYHAALFATSTGGADWLGDIAFLAVINRSISDQEVAEWSADPWIFCRPDMTRRVALLVPQAVAGVTMPRFYHHYQRNTG